MNINGCNHYKDFMDSYANTLLDTVVDAIFCLQTKQQTLIIVSGFKKYIYNYLLLT